jgi:2-oxoglutarate ferredoxin oxidoreductase subunit beta
LNSVRNILRAKDAVKKAFETQQEELGFSFVEMLSACPTGWHMTPLDSLAWIDEAMIKQYPLGEFSVPRPQAPSMDSQKSQHPVPKIETLAEVGRE